MGTPFLEVDTISKSFGGLKAVSDVSFSMARDEIIGLDRAEWCRENHAVKVDNRNFKIGFRHDQI